MTPLRNFDQSGELYSWDNFEKLQLEDIFEHDLAGFEAIIDSIKFSKPRISIPEWAEKSRIMPPGTPFAGKWENGRAPYHTEIAWHCSPQSSTEVIVYIKPAQIGGTASTAENKIGHAIEIDPQHILYVTATKELAEEWSKKRIGPLIELCGLSEYIRAPNQKSGGKATGDTTLSKSFHGGSVLFASYNQAAMMRSSSFQCVVFDEIDAAPESVGIEGDARKLGEVRTSMFERRKKIIILSTPLDKSTSKVWKAFLEGDMCYYWMPCPHCDEMIHMRLLDEGMKINLEFDYKNKEKNVIDESSVGYPCPECGALIKTHHKEKMFASERCDWRATNDDPMPRTKSFFTDALYAAVGGVSFETIAQEWAKAIGNPADMRAFINLRGAMPYEDMGDGATDEQVLSKCGGYKRGEVPSDAILVTCGCDLHGDRLDVVIKGYNGRTNWTIDWRQYLGDPTMNDGGSLDQFARDFAAGVLPGKPKCAFIDDGYEPDQVIKCAETHPDIFAVKGEKWINGGAVFAESTMKKFDGAKYIRVNTGVLKGYIMRSLQMEPFAEGFPDGFPHFPTNIPKAFVEQLNSERRIPVYNEKTGQIRAWEWKEFHSKGNHVLDCSVYADAACEYQVYRISQLFSIDEGYRDIVWECLRDPSKVDLLAQGGAFD